MQTYSIVVLRCTFCSFVHYKEMGNNRLLDIQCELTKIEAKRKGFLVGCKNNKSLPNYFVQWLAFSLYNLWSRGITTVCYQGVCTLTKIEAKTNCCLTIWCSG